MDALAVYEATQEDLHHLGLTEKGHILCLKYFAMKNCQSNVKDDEKKETLANSIKQCSNERTTKRVKRHQTKSVQIGWKHASSGSMFVQVRKQSGGGVRESTFSNSDTLLKIKNEAINLFFPGGKSKKYGYSQNVSTSLGDFSGDVIEDLNCTISNYNHRIKMTGRMRLYLLTKRKNDIKEMLLRDPVQLTSSDSDDDFDIPVMDNNSIEAAKTSSLIGTTDERASFFQESQVAYETSLAADQQKELEKVEIAIKDTNRLQEEMKLEFENEGRLSALMAARKMRVTPEPELYESHVTICVRHLTLGNKVRLFREGVLFQAVYDWIGSINQTPEFFQLKDHKGITISPDQLIQSGTFNMLACSSPVNMSPNGTVAFLGFGTKNTTLNIIDEDDFHTHEEESVQHQVSSNSKQFDCLQSLREDAYDRLQNGNSYEVSRENIYNEMMTLYKKRNILSHKIFISFVNEDAVGHGVSRDAYSAFFESVYLKMEGFFEKVPMCRFEVEDAETLGKIITHAFICFDMFPIGICKSALKEFLKLEVTDEELFASFLEFLQPNEAELVRRCSRGLIEDVQPISDILFEYSIYTIPNKENVVQLITKAAKIALINTPCYLMQKVVSGMGNFWNKVSSHMISSLYDCTLPTSEKILSNLDANESCNQDQKVVTWLHRYIRCCSKEELQMLLRFVTGSPSIQPNMKIRVEFVDQMAQHLRPCSKTCFKILILPRQYSSFTEMKENLTVYIQNTSNWCVDDNILMI